MVPDHPAAGPRQTRRARTERRRLVGTPNALLAAILVASLGRAAEPLTLPAAIERALAENRTLKLLQTQVASRGVAVQAAEAGFAWSFRPEGRTENADDGRLLAVGGQLSRRSSWGGDLSTRAEHLRQETDNAADLIRNTLRVELRQPLLRRAGTLPTLEPLRDAEAREAAARRELELRRTDLVVEVAEAYEELVRLRRQTESDQLALDRMNRFLRLARARERQGRGAREDSLRAELQQGAAALRLTNTIQRYRARMTAFADLLGAPPETEFTLDEIVRLEVAAPTEEEAVALALSNRLDYAQVLQDARDAERGLRLARNNLLPDLQLLTRYERFGEGRHSSEAFPLREDIWFVSLAASSDWPARQERFAARQAVLSSEAADVRAAAVEAAIRRQTRQELLAYQRAQAQEPIAAANLEAARKRMHLARRLFEIGRGDGFSVTDSESELLQAEADWRAAESERTLAGYRLLRVLGLLLEYPPDLKPDGVR